MSDDDGTELFVRDLGSGDPIVFLYGWPLGHRMFESQYHHLLAENFRCIGIDHCGYGKSDKPAGDYGYDRFADDLKGVLDASSFRTSLSRSFRWTAAS